MIWECLFEDNLLIVRCEGVVTAHEVRDYASWRLGCEPGQVSMKQVESAEHDVWLRWVGDDYAAGGTLYRRRMQESWNMGECWRDV